MQTPSSVKIVFVCLFLIFSEYAFSQGCSDAGFCTLNSFKPNSNDTTSRTNNQIKVGASYGDGDHSIAVFANYIEYNRQISRRFGLDLKLTSILQNGNGISIFGLSDVFLNANWNATEKLKLTLGAKVPLTNAGRTLDQRPLPMDYQSSLGTFDLIAGIGYAFKNIQLVAAIQQPLTQNNNQFVASAYPQESPLRQFQSTNAFKRSGDVLLRISYPVPLGKKIRITPSLLPIYHLANDRYTNEFNQNVAITGSKGLTLNGNIYVDYSINEKNTLQLNVGKPFVVRDVRPDGLTRSLLINLEYRIQF